jgi:diguanylate cyclase (GGDEF)-like protein
VRACLAGSDERLAEPPDGVSGTFVPRTSRWKAEFLADRKGRSPSRESPGVRGFTAILVLTAAVLWMAVVRGYHAPDAPLRLPWPLLALGFAASAVMVVRFEFRGEAEALTLSEVPLLVGLVFAGPGRLLLAAVVGCLAGVVIYRRQSPTKAAFNVSAQALETLVALVCYHLVLAGASAVSGRGLLAALVTAPVADLVSEASVLVVITLCGRLPGSSLVTLATVSGAVAMVNATLGFVAVTACWASPWGLVMFVGIAAVASFGYRTYSALRQRNADVEDLYRFSRTLSGLDEVDEVIAAVLSAAKRLLRCEFVEIAMYDADGLQCHSLDQDDHSQISNLPAFDPVRRRVEATNHAVLIPHAATEIELREAVRSIDLRDAIAAPIPGAPDCLGVLLVGNRLGDQTVFESADVKLLDALAAQSGAALQKGRLLDGWRHEAADKHFQARHDALTGLSNRTMFTERLDAALAARRGDTVVAVMLMDLDAFKEVNDTLGHDIGDALLQRIAYGLATAVKPPGLVSRLGGDEFAMVVSVDRAEVDAISRSILAAAQHPVEIDGIVLEVRASLGVALCPEQGNDTATLLREADVAMYQAKANKSGVEVYDAHRDQYTTRRLLLVGDLHHALQTSALHLYYQPKAELSSGQVTGVEALLRWTHPRYGAVTPDEFIPVAEHSGLIRPLTLWVLETALDQMAEWQIDGIDLTMAFNVSARSVIDGELVSDIDHLMSAVRMDPSKLTLELTESSLPADRNRSERVLAGLASLGVRLAIDDFGTGYSSLSRLKRLPVHEVKIDRSFVASMVARHDDNAIVQSTVNLAHNLGLTVVAEGVEDEATWDQLRRLECDSAQGYYVSPPLPGPLLAGWLRHRAPGHAILVPRGRG